MKKTRVVSMVWVMTVAFAPSLVATDEAMAYSVSMTKKNTGKIVRWPKTNVPYYLHPSCSTDLNAATCLQECKKSFAKWLGHSCSSLGFTYAGASNTKKLTSVGYNANGKNEIAWIENGQWTYGKWVLGVTSPYFYTTGPQAGAITEADIAMNGYQHTWQMTGKSYTTDVMNVLVHEIGHFFGLQHNLYPNGSNPETMAPQADNHMKSRTPEKDDIAGLCYLYPKSGSTACASQKDCPYVVDDGPQGEYYAGQISCSSGTCGGTSAPVQQGGKKLGDACSTQSDCDKPLFCQPLSGAQAVCSQECNPQQSGSCPSGFQCIGYQNQPTKGACIKSQGGSGGGKAIGDTCTSSSECKSQMCVALDGKQQCEQPCAQDYHCKSDQKCQKFSGKSYGACVDNNAGSSGGGSSGGSSSGGTNPTKKALGDICYASAECASALCVGSGGNSGICTQKCVTSTDCGTGKACVKLSSGAGACVKSGDKKLGDTCAKSSDCEGGLCVASSGKYICSKPCTSNAECPTDYKCYQLSSGSGGCFKGPSKKADGEACQGSSECNSGLCAGSGNQASCVQPCKSDSQCQAGFACFDLSGGGGACFKLGDKKTGESCAKPSECASGNCVGIDGKYICTSACKATVDCPCGYECTKFQGGDEYCAAGKKVSCVENGQACANDSECVSEKCLSGKCVATCSIFAGDQTCPDGKGCVRLEDDKPLGVCSTKGPNGFGGKCSNDTFCKSLFCHSGECGTPCNPFGPNNCKLGLVCEVANGAVGHCTFDSTGGGTTSSSSGSSSGGSSSSSSSSGASGGSSSSSGSSSGASSGGSSSSGSSSGAADVVGGADVNQPTQQPMGVHQGNDSSGCNAASVADTRHNETAIALLIVALLALVGRRHWSMP